MSDVTSLAKYDELFENILREGGIKGGGPGYLLTKEISDRNIPRPYLYDYLSRHPEIQKLDRGIYYRGDNPDNYYVLSLHKKIIFSHSSSCYLHGLTGAAPVQPEVCLPAGYNKGRMSGDPEQVSFVDGTNIKIHLVYPNEYKEDIETIKTEYGHSVMTYCVEKAVCQMIRDPGGCSNDQYYHAVKAYFRRDTIDHQKIRSYAKKYGIEDKVFEYYNLLR